MVTASQLLGFGGVALGFTGYLPQILHLIGQECSAGISIRAYLIWLAAAMLLLIHALVIFDGVFILLQSLGACLDVTVIMFAARYRGRTCPLHS